VLNLPFATPWHEKIFRQTAENRKNHRLIPGTDPHRPRFFPVFSRFSYHPPKVRRGWGSCRKQGIRASILAHSLLRKAPGITFPGKPSGNRSSLTAEYSNGFAWDSHPLPY